MISQPRIRAYKPVDGSTIYERPSNIYIRSFGENQKRGPKSNVKHSRNIRGKRNYKSWLLFPWNSSEPNAKYSSFQSKYLHTIMPIH